MSEENVLLGEANNESQEEQDSEVKEEPVKEEKDTGKDESDKETDEDAESDKSKESEGAPDKYEDFTLPEGYEPDVDTLDSFKDFAKSKNLSQDEAQQLIDLQTKNLEDNFTKLQDEWKNIQKEWREDSEKDKEFGGTAFNENLGLAKKALDEFGNKELAEALEVTGMGNHPELIRFLVNVGKKMAEDGVLRSGADQRGDKTPAEILFPGMAKGE